MIFRLQRPLQVRLGLLVDLPLSELFLTSESHTYTPNTGISLDQTSILLCSLLAFQLPLGATSAHSSMGETTYLSTVLSTALSTDVPHQWPPLVPEADQEPTGDEMDHKSSQRSTGIAGIHSTGFIVEPITAENQGPG